MSVARTIVGWITPMVILGAGIAIFLSMGSQPPPERKAATVATALPVRTAAVESVTEGLTIEADGAVVPLREVTLAAEVAGRVKGKGEACNEGQFVKAGTLLFEIDPRDYELDVERLERELKQADLAIEELDEEAAQNVELVDLARRQIELARREVARLEALKAGRIVTESEHDRALRDELTAANAVSTLDGQRRVLAKRRNKLLEARSLAATMLEKANLDLSRTAIKAPIDGLIVEDKVEQGSFVSKGTPLVTIEDTSAAEVRTSLEMDDLARIWGGRRGDGSASTGHGRDAYDTPASVIFRVGESAYEWDGVLSRQEGRGLDEKTRTLPCRVLIKNPDRVRALDRYGATMPQAPAGAPRSLLRGMFVQVHVHVDSPEALVSIPDEAQRPNGEVWVMRDGRLTVLRPRAVQASAGRLVFDSLASGLQAGDRVIVSQISNPRDGMAVTETSPMPVQPTTQTARRDGEDAT
ncbi:MAG: HlyD family efflux transporter periplasmic adaptor subunit [Planctomycetia bacterium]|nr:HlyD family efflux transporter periplasmic adaptor subunit [Planctomycetia bacterium]